MEPRGHHYPSKFEHRLIQMKNAGEYERHADALPARHTDGLLGVQDVFLFDMADGSGMWAILYVCDHGYESEQLFSEDAARVAWESITATIERAKS